MVTNHVTGGSKGSYKQLCPHNFGHCNFMACTESSVGAFGIVYDSTMQGPRECDQAHVLLWIDCFDETSYKGSQFRDQQCDSTLSNMERYYAEEVASFFVNNYTCHVPLELSTVYSQLFETKIVDSIATAATAIQYLRTTLPSSIVVERENSFGEFLTFINIDCLSVWLRSCNAHFKADIIDNESEHSWDSWANNTTITSIDSCGSPDATGKPGNLLRQQLASELFKVMSHNTGADSLSSEFQSLMMARSCRQNQERTAQINRAPLARYIEICPHNDPFECNSMGRLDCRNKLHLERVVTPTTDESLGDCNYLDTCFKGRGCRYVHYRVQLPANRTILLNKSQLLKSDEPKPQWIQCNLQRIDLTKMGNDYGVIIADPPWDIHMNTTKSNGNALRDDDIAKLAVGALQTEGIIFLWVTGRALDAGRECLKKWGYTHTEELVWIKINQLGRTIGTGRTGHWLNHTKEHVLVGVKGSPKFLAKQLDVDTIVSVSRGNSHKPTELYDIIERMVGNQTRKIELFGRENNLRPGWLTLGCELKGVQLNDPLLNFRWARASKR